MAEARIDELREDPAPPAQFRTLTVIAQDPSVKVDGKVLTAPAKVPAEHLESGPRGARFHVVDYDTESGQLLKPAELPEATDRFADAPEETLIDDPAFRAQNVYAIAARTLAAFESALGRRLAWSFPGHQLYLVPRAMAEANAFYSPEDWALHFGFVPQADGTEIATCLSHDVVAHETTHAILDGLRPRFMDPSLPDQPGFHEGLGDIVALLSVFSMPDVVERLIDDGGVSPQVSISDDEDQQIAATALFTLAEQMGEATSGERGRGLRRSAQLKPDPTWRDKPEFQEPHRRGEVVVACVLQTLIETWTNRLKALVSEHGADRVRVAEEGAKAAGHLLTMVIRGIDYMPPVELEFEDVVDAIVKADEVAAPDDEHQYRDALEQAFGQFGIQRPKGRIINLAKKVPRYERMNFTSLRADRDEVARFLWENAEVFGGDPDAPGSDPETLGIDRRFALRVESVRPAVRVGPDGLVVAEVIADYTQNLELTAGEFATQSKTDLPAGLDPATKVQLWGGGAVIFDQFGRAKFHQTKPLADWERQWRRLAYLVANGLVDSQGRFGFGLKATRGERFAALHLPEPRVEESW